MQLRARGSFIKLSLVFIALYATGAVVAQTPARTPLSAEQLDTLVAPIALYPDPLLGQVLAASTYPLELVVAQQWLDQHADLHGTALLDAAKQMNWDPSVQAMVSFPDVLRTLTQNVSWTTDLGNAFLGQQADVMDAIQRMRVRARQNGRLESTPQQAVSDAPGPDRNVVAIQPADPQVLYVPRYNPYYVWGAPAEGDYPSLWYPSSGFGFGTATAIGSLFSGLLGWSGWGWGLNWLTHGLLTNGLFLNQFGFENSGGGYGSAPYSAAAAANGVTAWMHNPAHRLGVPYTTAALAGRFGGFSRGNNWQSFGTRNGGGYRYRAPNTGAAPYRSVQANRGYSAPAFHSGRTPQNYASAAPQQHYAVPQQHYAVPQQHYTAPSQHYSVPPQRYSVPPQQYSRSYTEPKRSGGGHFSFPKSHSFKPPKYSAPKGSSHSSKGHTKSHSGGHSKSHITNFVNSDPQA